MKASGAIMTTIGKADITQKIKLVYHEDPSDHARGIIEYMINPPTRR